APRATKGCTSPREPAVGMTMRNESLLSALQTTPRQAPLPLGVRVQGVRVRVPPRAGQENYSDSGKLGAIPVPPQTGQVRPQSAPGMSLAPVVPSGEVPRKGARRYGPEQARGDRQSGAGIDPDNEPGDRSRR